MKILTFTFETELEFSEPVESHDFLLRCQPTSTVAQTVFDATTIVAPATALARQTDGFGNLLQLGRIESPHSEFAFVSSGTVLVDAEGSHACRPHPVYSRPSEMCQPGPTVQAFAKDVLQVCPNLGPWEKAQRLSHALHTAMAYEPGTTTVSTTAEEALAQMKGVCQDYTHALVTLCREAGIPARYVNGFLIGVGATHAWAEVHDGERWHGIDPTNDCLVNDNYIALSHGRDFSDCPIEAGTFRGGARQSQHVKVEVTDDAKRGWSA